MLVMIVVIMYKPAVDNKKPSGVLITRLIAPDELLNYEPSIPFLPILPKKRSSIPTKSGPPMTIPKTEDRSAVLSENDMRKEEVPSPSQESKEQLESKNLLQEYYKPQYLSREKLFDKGVIGNLAKKETKREKEGEKGKSLTLDMKDYKFLIYNKRLKERIEGIWIYPYDAAKRGIYGDLIIQFTIKKNGTLGAVELIRTSGHQNLDDAAMKALKNGEPYWPLPDEWKMETYTILGHFVYTIYGYYLR